MPQLVTCGSEFLRINAQKNSIEYSSIFAKGPTHNVSLVELCLPPNIIRILHLNKLSSANDMYSKARLLCESSHSLLVSSYN